MARIAVVGDVYGHLAVLYAILGRWQREWLESATRDSWRRWGKVSNQRSSS